MVSEFDGLQAALPKRYKLIRELDRGGMSRVYLAREELPERSVAIKVLEPELSALLGRERFIREVEVTSRLEHPHIVPIYAAGDADGALFYVMPFIRGESLRDRLAREGCLAIETACAVAREVAGALEHAHDQGIVHRDIKPANILFQSGHAVVSDFGIARALWAGSTLTRADASLGTPDYMSPEQIAGEGEIDGRTDIYSLACVLYEMLGGQPPFHSRTARATLARHLTDQVPHLGSLREGVPRGLETTILRALAKAPADRFASAGEFAEAISREVSRPISRPAPRRSASRLPPAGIWFRLAGVLTAVAATGLAYNAWWGSSPVVAASAFRDSVAVMPLENRTGDPSLEWVGQSLADLVTDRLQQISDIRVAGSYSALSLWREDLDPERLLDSLNVGHLVEGTLEPREGGLSVVVSDLGADGSTHFTREFGAFTTQSLDSAMVAISGQLIDVLLSAMGIDEPASFVGADLGPGRAEYLLGVESLGQRTPSGVRAAVAHLSESIALDSTQALAHAALSSAYALSLAYSYDVGQPAYEAAALALLAAERAIDLDPRLPDGHSARGYALTLLGIDIEQAVRDFGRAQELSPNEPNAASWFSRVLLLRGMISEAYAEARRARDADRLQAGRHLALAAVALQAGDYEESYSSARFALGLEPTLVRAAAYEARALALTRRTAECLELELGAYSLVQALCLHLAGRRDEALALVDSAEFALAFGEARDERFLDDLAAAELAAYYAFVGDAPAAARWLTEAFGHSPVGVDPRIVGSALFEPVRDDPAFATALRRAQRAAEARIRATVTELRDR